MLVPTMAKPSASHRRTAKRSRLEGHERILLVADAPELGNLEARVLRYFGYRVRKATGALRAQELAREPRKTDLLIADLSSPDSILLELVAWFRATYPEIKVLIVTSSPWEISAHFSLLHDVFLLAKPFTPDQLAELLRRILD